MRRTIGLWQFILSLLSAFILGAEAILIWIGLNEKRGFADIFLRNGLTCIAMLMVIIAVILSMERPEDKTSERQDID